MTNKLWVLTPCLVCGLFYLFITRFYYRNWPR